MKKIVLGFAAACLVSVSAFAADSDQSENIQLAAAMGSGVGTTGSAMTSGFAASDAAESSTANMVGYGLLAVTIVAVIADSDSTNSH